MRITKISVKGLFGMFDHEIPLNQESRITIVHGPNGVGKTVTLRLVHSLFNGAGELLGNTPFAGLHVEFENGAAIGVEKIDRPRVMGIDRPGENRKLSIAFEDGTETEFKPFVSYLPEPEDLERAPADWQISIRLLTGPEWFGHIRADTETVLIHTLRLQSDLFDDYGQPTINVLDLYEDAYEPVVERFRRHFWENISAHETIVHDLEAWERLKELFEDEATSILNEDDMPLIAEDLQELWLSGRQKQLREFHQEIVSGAEDFPSSAGVLLFMEIINERCLFKSLVFKDGTISFRADDGSDVPLSALSSGEQHLLVLYYQLIFEIEPDTLVMIDEPELSMNVVWQRNFLKDLQRIIELRKFDVLIATHSPEVIYDKWDWTVALGEKVDD